MGDKEKTKQQNRKTGLDILGDVPWGTHFCLFYRSKEDLIDILVPYFKAGLENNEFCMWVTSGLCNVELAEKSLRRAITNLDDYIKKGQIEILEYSYWYTKSGSFEADEVLQGWVQKHDQAIEKGFDGLRLTGNTFWLNKRDWKKFVDYETVVNNVIDKYKMLAICTYSLDKCNASDIIDIVSTHQFAVIRQESQWKLIESSDRKKATVAIEDLNKDLEATVEKLTLANRELQDFAHSASHDLKTPLCGITRLAEWISTDYSDKLDDRGREQVNLLLSRVARMHNLIDGILEYIRVGREKEEQIQVDLNELVPRVIDMVAPPENIEIKVENELPIVDCEQTQIIQVFQNLLSNAIKFMDKPQGKVKIGCVEENGFWKFSIADNGSGIEERHFERVFKLFKTLQPRDKFESAGIGLAVAKKIVELYGGQIWLESERAKGSTFFFTLPKQKVGVASAELGANIAC